MVLKSVVDGGGVVVVLVDGAGVVVVLVDGAGVVVVLKIVVDGATVVVVVKVVVAGALVVVVVVVPGLAVVVSFAGEVCACAGTMTVSTTGRTHRSGMRATPTIPPAIACLSMRRRSATSSSRFSLSSLMVQSGTYS